ncbi:MAG: hypothetical protein ABEJ31_13955 [Haloarculaceae archaeon]
MEVPLSPRALRWVDLLSKLVAVVLLAGALAGEWGQWSLFLGVAGLVVGIVTVFLDPA